MQRELLDLFIGFSSSDKKKEVGRKKPSLPLPPEKNKKASLVTATGAAADGKHMM